MSEQYLLNNMFLSEIHIKQNLCIDHLMKML